MSSPTTRQGLPLLRAVVIIPARLDSRRLPRKMLLRETGGYLFEHTARNVQRCPAVARVVVATDSQVILEAAQGLGLEALLTSEAHPSGTDRVHEATLALEAAAPGSIDVVVNVQGDEPELDPEDLRRLIETFAEPEVQIATLCAPLRSEAESRETSVVKVVRDQRGNALYFSRAAIPDRSHARDDAGGESAEPRRHVGVYAYRPDALARFAALPPAPLETAESLEQLRWLEAGERMRVVEATSAPRGIDTAEDYASFVARMRGGTGSGGPGPGDVKVDLERAGA